jgi:hypothetical protein
MILGIPFFSRISDDWLVSRVAVVLFMASTVIVIVETPVWFGAITIPDTVVGNILGAKIGIVGALSIFFLWIGMWRYWIRIDKSKPAAKRLSFIILLIGFWYGAALYFLVRYLWIDKRMRIAVGA